MFYSSTVVLTLIHVCHFWFQARIEAEDLDNAGELDDESSSYDIVPLLDKAEELDDNNSNNHHDLPVVDNPIVGESVANINSNLLSVKEPAYSKKKVQTKPGSKVITIKYNFYGNSSGIFFVFSGAEIRPHSQWNLGDFFFQILKNKSQSKKIFFFLKIGIFIQLTHTRTRTSYMLTFSLNLMAIVFVIANLYFY